MNHIARTRNSGSLGVSGVRKTTPFLGAWNHPSSAGGLTTQQRHQRITLQSPIVVQTTFFPTDTVVAPSSGMEPAVLEGTPESFPYDEETLVARAKEVFLETMTGVKDESVLADNFRFEFPIVSLDKEAYLKAVRGFQLTDAIPDMDAHPYDFRTDKYEPNRVWFTVRNTGTHTGELKFGSKSYPATGREIKGAPECLSYVFDTDLKVACFTGGYVMDRRVGNTEGMGALFGILAAIGVNFPKPGTLAWTFFTFVNRVVTKIKNFFNSVSKKE